MFNLTSTSTSLSTSVREVLMGLESSICEAATSLRGALLASGWVSQSDATALMVAYVEAADSLRADYRTNMSMAIQVAKALEAGVEVESTSIVTSAPMEVLASMAEALQDQDPSRETVLMVSDALLVLDRSIRGALTSLEG